MVLCSVNKLPGKTEIGKMLDLQGNLLKVRGCILLNSGPSSYLAMHLKGFDILADLHVVCICMLLAGCYCQ